MTHDFLALADWLSSLGITHVALEATGEVWTPVSTILEARCTVLVVNAHPIKTVPGRKPDVKDAAWIAALLRHGLLRVSFIPPLPQRDLRDLTRQRTHLVQDRATVVNRLQQVLEGANRNLTSVATAVTGVSARAMLEGIIADEADPAAWAELAPGRMRNKRAALEQALTGRVRAHHRYVRAQPLMPLDFLDEQIEALEQQIGRMIARDAPTDVPPGERAGGGPLPHAAEEGTAEAGAGSGMAWADAGALLDTIPGVGRTAAAHSVAALGTDMGRGARAAHGASWATVCPGNHASAGKRRSGATGQGNRWVRRVLIPAAWAAVKVKDAPLAAVDHRLAGRRGVKQAILAVAHRILVAASYMVRDQEP